MSAAQTNHPPSADGTLFTKEGKGCSGKYHLYILTNARLELLLITYSAALFQDFPIPFERVCHRRIPRQV